jgi:serine/threonine protein kinase
VDGQSSRQSSWTPTGLGPGSSLAGYLLEDQVGVGGMAVVFRARDERLYRTVALKVLAPGLAGDDEFRERFIREPRAAAAVDHPHIIPVYNAGEADGVLYIAMRFISGSDLRSILRQEGPLSAERAALLLSPIASALDAAHAAGLIHRDVKPANILVDASPGRPEHPYLSDFGVAKGLSSAISLTGTDQFIGTPHFCAPEQISGRPTLPQTDQYALACVAFTMLTGKMPFARAEQSAVFWAHMYEPPPSAVSIRPSLPAAVDQVVSKALAKVPQNRFGTCGEFADSLRSALGVAPYALPDPIGGDRSIQDSVVSISPTSPAPREPTTTSMPYRAPTGATMAGRPDVAPPVPRAAPAHRARRPRGPWIAVTAAVAVVVAGAVTASTLLFKPGTHAGLPANRHTSSPASRAGAATASHRGTTAILSGTFKDPGGKGILAVAFRDDGALAAVDGNGHAYVFAVRSHSVIDTLALGSRGTSYAQLSPDGRILSEPSPGCLSSVGACEFILTDVATGHEVGAVPNSYGFLSIGNSAAAAVDTEQDGMNVVSTASGSTIADVIDPDHHFVVGGAISGDGKVMAASSDGGGATHTVYIWDVAAKTLSATLKVAGGTAIGQSSLGPSAGAAALDQDGKTLAVTDGVKTYVYSVPSGHQVSVVSAAMLALSSDGTLLATVDDAGQVQLWNVATAKVVAGLAFVPDGGGPLPVAFSGDGKQVAVGFGNGSTSVWTISR